MKIEELQKLKPGDTLAVVVLGQKISTTVVRGVKPVEAAPEVKKPPSP